MRVKHAIAVYLVTFAAMVAFDAIYDVLSKNPLTLHEIVHSLILAPFVAAIAVRLSRSNTAGELSYTESPPVSEPTAGQLDAERARDLLPEKLGSVK